MWNSLGVWDSNRLHNPREKTGSSYRISRKEDVSVCVIFALPIEQLTEKKKDW